MQQQFEDPKIGNAGPDQPTNNPGDVTNDPEEAIDTPQEVEESNDEKIDEDYPGYPHYPAKDDILNPGNERVDLDVENLTRSNTISTEHMKQIMGTPEVEDDITTAIDEDPADLEMVPGTDADVTAEDLMILGDRDEDMDMDEDEDLRSRGWLPVTGKDLDVPEDEDPTEDDALGQGDEENSYYSLGGDEKSALDDSNDQNNF